MDKKDLRDKCYRIIEKFSDDQELKHEQTLLLYNFINVLLRNFNDQ